MKLLLAPTRIILETGGIKMRVWTGETLQSGTRCQALIAVIASEAGDGAPDIEAALDATENPRVPGFPVAAADLKPAEGMEE